MSYKGMQGIDCTSTFPVSVMNQQHLGFICRYTGTGGDWKHVSQAELDSYVHAGKHVVLNAEAWGGSQGHRDVHTHAQGVADARDADRDARDLGYPDAPVFFSIDYDAPPGDQAAINSYFRGIASVIGKDRVGAYGGYGVIRRLLDAGLIAYAWQTYAWSDGHVDGRAHIYQYRNHIRIAGHSVDRNRVLKAGGNYFGCACCKEDDMPLSHDDIKRVTDSVVNSLLKKELPPPSILKEGSVEHSLNNLLFGREGVRVDGEVAHALRHTQVTIDTLAGNLQAAQSALLAAIEAEPVPNIDPDDLMRAGLPQSIALALVQVLADGAGVQK